MKILIALQTFGEFGAEPLGILKGSGVGVILNDLGRRLNEDEIVKLGNGCDGIIAGVEPYTKKVLDDLPRLKCISRCGVGLDNIDLEVARQKGIAVLNTPDVVTQPVVEMTLAMIFDLSRKLSLHTALLKSGRWEKRAGLLLKGKNAGIIGLGRIGKKVAEALCGLGLNVYGTDIAPDVKWADYNKIKITDLAGLLKISDIVSLHVSVSKKMPFFLSSKEIGMMKDGSVIINTSRGSAIDEKALFEALKNGRISGAGLDVFSKEPYQGPLASLDNVVLTPHIASFTKESRDEMESQAARNLLKGLSLV